MAKTSPTQRTLKHYRELGFDCWVVEKWNPHAKVRQDLFNFIDIVAMDGDRIIGIQSTSYSNHATRRNKILENKYAQVWYRSGGEIIVSSWRKISPRKHEHREEYIRFPMVIED